MSKSDEVVGKIVTGVFVTVGVIGGIAGVGLLMAWPIKWAWNVTMPYLFSLPTITWGKAWCLNFLTGCLLRPTITSKK